VEREQCALQLDDRPSYDAFEDGTAYVNLNSKRHLERRHAGLLVQHRVRQVRNPPP
jgi:hypothetical protein